MYIEVLCAGCYLESAPILVNFYKIALAISFRIFHKALKARGLKHCKVFHLLYRETNNIHVKCLKVVSFASARVTSTRYALN